MAKFTLNLKSKTFTDGRKPLVFTLSHQGERTEIYTGYVVHPSEWDGEGLKPKIRGATELNRNIQKLTDDLRKVIRDFEYVGYPFTVEEIKEAFAPSLGRKKEKQDANLFLPYIDAFIRAKSGKYTEGTLDSYRALQYRIEQFEKVNGSVQVDDINEEWFGQWNKFLWGKGLVNNTVHRHDSKIVAVLNFAKSKGVKIAEGYNQIGVKEHSKEVIFLTWEEMEVLRELSLPEHLDRARDLFLFSCYTGLRHSDIYNWHKGNVKGDFIKLNMIKVGEPVMIPLNQYSRAILDKYKGHLPKLTDQECNKNLKIIGAKAGFDDDQRRVRFRGAERIEEAKAKWELLTFHVGRASFIMHHLSKGIAETPIMRMTGHADWRSFKRYVRYTEELLSEISQRVWG